MNNQELLNVKGGGDMSASFLKELVKAITELYDLGKKVGSFIISKVIKKCIS